jgi:hypothetical protein
VSASCALAISVRGRDSHFRSTNCLQHRKRGCVPCAACSHSDSGQLTVSWYTLWCSHHSRAAHRQSNPPSVLGAPTAETLSLASLCQHVRIVQLWSESRLCPLYRSSRLRSVGLPPQAQCHALHSLGPSRPMVLIDGDSMPCSNSGSLPL